MNAGAAKEIRVFRWKLSRPRFADAMDGVGEGAEAVFSLLLYAAWGIVSLLVGAGVFFGVWYDVSITYGFLGFALGWMPAAILAVLAFWLWPLGVFALWLLLKS